MVAVPDAVSEPMVPVEVVFHGDVFDDSDFKAEISIGGAIIASGEEKEVEGESFEFADILCVDGDIGVDFAVGSALEEADADFKECGAIGGVVGFEVVFKGEVGGRFVEWRGCRWLV